MTINKKVITVTLVIAFTPLFGWALNTITSGFKTTTSGIIIDAHGVCHKVRHTGGTASFVPTRSSAEWSAFRGNQNSAILSSCSQWVSGSGNCSTVCGSAGLTSTTDAQGNICRSSNTGTNGSNGKQYTTEAEGKCIHYDGSGTGGCPWRSDGPKFYSQCYTKAPKGFVNHNSSYTGHNTTSCYCE